MLATTKEEEGEEPHESATEDIITPTISLNSVVGFTNPCTMKLLATINGKEVVVMVDLGANHNFLSTTTATTLNIPITPTDEFGISLGTVFCPRHRGLSRGKAGIA